MHAGQMLGVAVCVLMVRAGGAAAQQVDFQFFDDFPDGLRQYAFGMSGDGQYVAGATYRNDLSVTVATRWGADGGVESLVNGTAHDVSLDGRSVIVNASQFQRMYHCVDGDCELLMRGNIVGAGMVNALSDNGQFATGYFRGSTGDDEAFLWSEATGIVGLGFGDGMQETQARGISPDGSIVVGEADFGSGLRRAFRWTADNGYETVESEIGENPLTDAFDVSGDGAVIVGVADSSPAYWREGFGTYRLPPLQRRSTGYAFAVTPDGTRIVGTDIDSGDEIAFLWTRERGTRSIQNMLEDDYGFVIDGFTLERAYAISNDGRTIAGVGSFDGQNYERAWRVVLPCLADLNSDQSVDTLDFLVFLNLWNTNDEIADWNKDGSINTLDFLAYLNLWVEGC